MKLKSHIMHEKTIYSNIYDNRDGVSVAEEEQVSLLYFFAEF